MSYTFTVPPTKEVGSYSGTCSGGMYETRAQNALADYNSARAHDGLAPLKRMPAGTKYHRKTRDIYVIQGWEDENQEETRQDGKRSLREYRDNGPGSYRMVSPWNQSAEGYRRRKPTKPKRSNEIPSPPHSGSRLTGTHARTFPPLAHHQ